MTIAESEVHPAHELVNVGDSVFWYPDGNPRGEPYCGIVTGKGMFTLDLAVIQASTTRIHPVNAVRHVNDTTVPPEERADIGGWDFTVQTRAMIDMKGQVDSLKLAVAALSSKAGPKK